MCCILYHSSIGALTDDFCSWIDQPDGPSWGEHYGQDVDLLNMEQFVDQIEECDFKSAQLLKKRLLAQKERLEAEAVIRAEEHAIEAAEEAARAAEKAARAAAAKELAHEIAAQQAAEEAAAAPEEGPAAPEESPEHRRKNLKLSQLIRGEEAEERAEEKGPEVALKAALAAAEVDATRRALEAAPASGDPATVAEAQQAGADTARIKTKPESKIAHEHVKKKIAELVAAQEAAASAAAPRNREETQLEDSQTSIQKSAGAGPEVDEEPEVSYASLRSLIFTCCIVSLCPCLASNLC